MIKLKITSLNLFLCVALICSFSVSSLAQDETQEETKPTVDSFLKDGEKLIKDNELEKAYETLSQGLKEYPENLELCLKAGETALLCDFADQSVEHLFKAINLNPDSYQANLLMGRAMRRQGEVVASDLMTQNDGYMMIEDALGFMKKAVDLNKKATKASQDLANTFIFLGDLDQADSAIDKGIKRSPKDTDLMLLKADIAYRKYRNAGAAGENAKEVRKKWEDAKRLYTRVQDVDIKNPMSYMGIGTLYECDKKWDDALKAYQEALSRNPDLENAYSRIIAIHTFKASQAANDEGDTQEKDQGPTLVETLEDILKQIKKRYPRDKTKTATALYYLGYAYYEDYEYEKSIDVYKQCAELIPDYATAAAYSTMRAAYKIGKHNTACNAFMRALKRDPEGLTYFMENDRKFADETYAMLNYLAYHLVNNNRLNDARKLNKQLLKVVTEDHSLHNNYAFLCRETQRYEESYKAYESALEYAPTNPSYLNDAALILHYHLHRDLDKAEEMYKQAIVEAQQILAEKLAAPAELEAARVALRDAKNNLRLLKAGVLKER